MKIDPFIRLSETLTGEKKLDHTLAEQFHRRLLAQYGAELSGFLEAFESRRSGSAEDALSSLLNEDPSNVKVVDSRHRVARAVVWIWYTGQFSTPFEVPDGPQTVDEYSKGLVWSVIRAHAPGYTNAPYGAWARLPDGN